MSRAAQQGSGGDVRAVEWRASDGVRIVGWDRPAEGREWAVVALVHGMGEHAGRYRELAEALAAEGVATVAFDQRGHGRSGGPKGHSPSYGLLMESVGEVLRQAAARHPGVPVFLMGHSMGGNLVLNYALRHLGGGRQEGGAGGEGGAAGRGAADSRAAAGPEVAGLIVSAPWLELAFEPNRVQVALAGAVRKVWPRFTQSTALEAEAISREAAQVEAYRADPLIHDRITAAMFLDVHAQGRWALEHAGELRVPAFWVHGTGDRLTSFAASERFAREAGEVVRFLPIEGGFHETHHELWETREGVLREMLGWMGARAGRAG